MKLRSREGNEPRCQSTIALLHPRLEQINCSDVEHATNNEEKKKKRSQG
jgi:hypothetical protein